LSINPISVMPKTTMAAPKRGRLEEVAVFIPPALSPSEVTAIDDAL
jgi:hypothetical protein